MLRHWYWPHGIRGSHHGSIGGCCDRCLGIRQADVDEQLRKASGADGEEDHSLSDEEAAIYSDIKGDITMFDFGGPLSFGAAADRHCTRARITNDHCALASDLAKFMDVAARAVETIAVDAHYGGKRIYACGVAKKWQFWRVWCNRPPLF